MREVGQKSEQKLRVFVFDDEPLMRSLLKEIGASRGYEVRTFTRPTLCGECRCKTGEVCTDIVVSDINMPEFTGIEFLVNQLTKSCKVKKLALMSAIWTEEQLQTADALGCKIFGKPVDTTELKAWLDECEAEIDPGKRVLASWFLDDASACEDAD